MKGIDRLDNTHEGDPHGFGENGISDSRLAKSRHIVERKTRRRDFEQSFSVSPECAQAEKEALEAQLALAREGALSIEEGGGLQQSTTEVSTLSVPEVQV